MTNPTTTRATLWNVGIMTHLLNVKLEQAPATAREWGFDGIQITLGTEDDVNRWADREYRKTLRDAAAKARCEIPSLCPTLLNQGNLGNDEPHLHRHAERVTRTLIAAAADLGARNILMPFFGTADLKGPAKIDPMIDRLKPLAALAHKAGVTLGLETTLSADVLSDILRRVGSPAVKVYYDLANAVWQGYDLAEEIRALRAAIVEVHVKDNVADPKGWGGFRVVPLGQGRVDFDAAARALRAARFAGWLVLETAVTNGDHRRSAVAQLEFTHQHFR